VERVDVVLIGAGRMGQIHGPNAAAHPRLRLKYVVDPDRSSAEDVASRFNARVVSLDEALADRQVGAVLVCSSTDQHLGHALAAVTAGKAVFCEKPVDLDLHKARQAQETMRQARFLLGFNRRFDPHFRALKQKVDSGAVGRLESLHLINHDPVAPPPGFLPASGGLFKDFTIHDLDLARWLLDEEPSQVYATASCLVDPQIARHGDVDTARTVLRTPSGKLCVISNTRRSGCGYDQRIEAYGSAGMVTAGNVAMDTVQTLTETSVTAAPIQHWFLQRYAQAYRAQIHHFADVVSGAARPEVTFDDGVAALSLAEACDQSLRTGTAIHL
jgi:myo-inositol 2-dehydrogenase/D-chiro-inositol 1-dehydrogenase